MNVRSEIVTRGPVLGFAVIGSELGLVNKGINGVECIFSGGLKLELKRGVKEVRENKIESHSYKKKGAYILYTLFRTKYTCDLSL